MTSTQTNAIIFLVHADKTLTRKLIWFSLCTLSKIDTVVTWYQMEMASTTKKRRMTCHATWDISTMILNNWINANTSPTNLYGMFVPTLLWFVDDCNHQEENGWNLIKVDNNQKIATIYQIKK